MGANQKHASNLLILTFELKMSRIIDFYIIYVTCPIRKKTYVNVWHTNDQYWTAVEENGNVTKKVLSDIFKNLLIF